VNEFFVCEKFKFVVCLLSTDVSIAVLIEPGFHSVLIFVYLLLFPDQPYVINYDQTLI